jgi:hypothetical protein
MTELAPQLFLYHRAVAPKDLHIALQALDQQLDFSHAFLEWWNAPAQCLTSSVALAAVEQSNPADLLSGSLFGDPAEVRFRFVPYPFGGVGKPQFWLALVSTVPLAGNGDWQPISVQWSGELQKTTLLLWGSRRQPNGAWTELQIPRWLEYPVIPETNSTKDGVLLDVVEYRDDAGEVVASRRVALRAVTVKAQVSEEAENVEAQEK